MSHKYPSKAHAPFDLERYLDSPAHIEAFLESVREENDPARLQQAIEAVETARRHRQAS